MLVDIFAVNLTQVLLAPAKIEMDDDALDEQITRGWKPISGGSPSASVGSTQNDVLCIEPPPIHLDCISISSDDSIGVFFFSFLFLIQATSSMVYHFLTVLFCIQVM